MTEKTQEIIKSTSGSDSHAKMVQERVVLAGTEELFRHVNAKDYQEGKILKTAFIPSKEPEKDDLQLSVDRCSITPNFKDSQRKFRSRGGNPKYTGRVAVSDFTDIHQTLESYEDRLKQEGVKEGNPAHALVDYKVIFQEGYEAASGRKARKIVATKIAAIANKNQIYSE